MNKANVRATFIPLGKAKVRATFIPNGSGSNGNLRYSIFISIDYSPLASEPTFPEACAFPDFISNSSFDLQKVTAGGVISLNQGLGKFNCLEAQDLWNLIFNNTFNTSPNLYFKDRPLPFQNSLPLSFIPDPKKIIKYFQSHYIYRILNKNPESRNFPTQLAGLKAIIDDRPSEIDDVLALIKHIHQNPTDGANTYSSRLNNSEEIHISEIISFFSTYPHVLRKLGLLFCYEIESSLIIGDGDKIQIRLVTPTNSIYEAEDPIPTVVEKVGKTFLAKSKKTDAYKNGLLNLQQVVKDNGNDEKRFSIVQNTAVEASYKSNAYLNTTNKENVPSITTNGIYLIDNYRKKEEGDELDNANKTELYLEDILTGLRFDLKISNPKEGETPSWKCLNAKSSKYQFFHKKGDDQLLERMQNDEEMEEGWTNTDTKTKTKDKAGKDTEVVADTLCHLNGWGLNTSNPLQEAAQNIKKDSTPAETGDPVHDFLRDKFQVTSKSSKSSLHPLRTGLVYQLRARLVTLDGYSISMNEADAATLDDANGNPMLRTSDFKFCRLESIGAPVFVLKHSIYDGDACQPNKTVKESKRGESEYILVIRSRDNNSKTHETTERGLAPAGISWHLAEWQSAFDTQNEYANTSKLKRSKNYIPQIIEKNNKKYWKPRTGKFNANGDKNRNIPYIIDPLSQCFEILCDENETYSLLFSKNPDLHFWKDNFEWWNIKTWEIVVKEQRRKQSPGTIRGKNCIFSIDAWNKTITILITKGEDLKFKIRTFPLDISNFHNNHLLCDLVYKLLDKQPNQSQKYITAKNNAFTTQNNNGIFNIRESLLFAEKEFRVVHAIKKPLFNPKFVDKSTIQRTWNPDEISFALITSTIFYPGKTSKKLELFANWQDMVDDGKSEKLIPKNFYNVFVDEYKLNGRIEKPVTSPAGTDNFILGEIEDYGQLINKTEPINIDTLISVFDLLYYCDSSTPILITLPSAVANDGKSLNFKNINSGMVTIQPFRTEETVDGEPYKLLNKLDKFQLESDGINWVLKKIQPFYVDSEKIFYIKHNFSDSKHRIVEYKLKATSRFVEFFPKQILDETDDNEFSIFSETVKVNIPSSQAPAAPKVAFVIPFFEWEFKSNERRRMGNRLRIYLERPWLSSGEGEKLAIIISNQPKYEEEYEVSKDHPNGKYQYISKWGRDVTTFGTNLLPLTAENFANKISVENNLTINNLLFKQRKLEKITEVGKPSYVKITNDIKKPFAAIVYNVTLDSENNYWYADIEFEGVSSYFPFIQLSIARYQKNSIPGEELSSNILCDFIQVAPTRTISFSKHGNYIDLSLFGSVYKADFDSTSNKTIMKNEVYIAFISRGNSKEGINDILYSSNGDNPESCDWHKIEDKDVTVLENGIVWRFKGVSPYNDYTVIIKEFETFHNDIKDVNPEKNPTKRLTFGDAIEI